MRGLYAIVDVKVLSAKGIDPVAFGRAVLAARPAALQLRAKQLPAREFLNVLRALGPLCRTAGVPLVANDRADLAALAGCDFVHIGQEDLPIELVRRLAPQLRVGVSTHNPAQLEKALQARPAYVAYGPIFPTTSKDQADPDVGIAGLAAAAKTARAAGIPLVAIGGITLDRVPEVAACTPVAAIIGGLVPDTPTDYVEVSRLAQAYATALSAASETPGVSGPSLAVSQAEPEAPDPEAFT
jgi:thiamine-phosphate pyrophosphorylase